MIKASSFLCRFEPVGRFSPAPSWARGGAAAEDGEEEEPSALEDKDENEDAEEEEAADDAEDDEAEDVEHSCLELRFREGPEAESNDLNFGEIRRIRHAASYLKSLPRTLL